MNRSKSSAVSSGMKSIHFSITDEDSDELKITPLGSGQEVGRSCHYLEFKGKKILLDFGIHPALTGMSALPFVDHIDPEQIDLVLVSHFHLDHAGGLPCNLTTEQMLYSESDLENSMNKISVINFHEEREFNGIKFWCYHAGHVLGAAMFMIQIAGIKILYTGDFSRQEDRHLMMAEIPDIRPDILIIESTYGVSVHEPRESREFRFTNSIQTIVTRGGRCLIPVFALGRAQELLLILDEYWEQHPELHEVPIYYASALAKKCMSVYQTYTNAMNEKIQRQIAISNPFQFKHISNLKGTPAKDILKEPDEIQTMAGQRLPMKCSVEYISFSAHTDFEQTSHFVRTIHPPNVVLVHGEMTEMGRLKSALEREYEGLTENPVKIFNPKNLETITFHFRGEKMAKVTGNLAVSLPKNNDIVSGILVKKNFNCHVISPQELNKYSELAVTTLSQRLSVNYTGSWQLLQYLMNTMFGNVDILTTDDPNQKVLRVFDSVNVVHEPPVIVLEWIASPTTDMYATAVMKMVLKAQDLKNDEHIINHNESFDKMHFKECLIELLQEMFGEECVPKIFKGENLYVVVNEHQANIDISEMVRVNIDYSK
ncbi:Cleavage and polyadenylation specificity factor subunit 3 [Armadillidium nasatum]|uniref:Cleavage and polyadenylation specificity factor subunit 3 n=1 Tax=Armadillidium nasatum TaxID=96803 RepID=A0A5N5TLK6_9CRUS|nr:Cleavage and polyadenylation specificity factor subunit 3 [Armadillidium nasatum]